MGAFEDLGIERRHLPLRGYRGAVGETRRYFPLKLPIALESERIHNCRNRLVTES